MKHGNQLDKIQDKIVAAGANQGFIQEIMRDVVDYGDLCYDDGVEWALDQEGCR